MRLRPGPSQPLRRALEKFARINTGALDSATKTVPFALWLMIGCPPSDLPTAPAGRISALFDDCVIDVNQKPCQRCIETLVVIAKAEIDVRGVPETCISGFCSDQVIIEYSADEPNTGSRRVHWPLWSCLRSRTLVRASAERLYLIGTA